MILKEILQLSTLEKSQLPESFGSSFPLNNKGIICASHQAKRIQKSGYKPVANPYTFRYNLQPK